MAKLQINKSTELVFQGPGIESPALQRKSNREHSIMTDGFFHCRDEPELPQFFKEKQVLVALITKNPLLLLSSFRDCSTVTTKIKKKKMILLSF